MNAPVALDVLIGTVALVGPAPRNADSRWPAVLAPTLPPWLKATDPLWRAEQDRRLLLREGRVVKSWVVMANETAFVPGQTAVPALVLHARSNDLPIETILEAAAAVTPLTRGKPVDADLAALAQEIAKPMAREMGWRVPKAIAMGHTLWLDTVLLHRSHLPRPYLASPLLPLLVHDQCPSVVVLPAPMWGNDLRAAWTDLAADL